MGRIKENMRNQMLILIPNVYTSIQLNQAAEFFGLQENELLPGKYLMNVICPSLILLCIELMNRGWKYDTNTKILCPVKIGKQNENRNNLFFYFCLFRFI